MARRATSLGPKHSLFVLVSVFVFFLFLFFLLGGSKGQVRRPKMSPQKGILFFFSVSLCFSLAFSTPPFHSLVLSVFLFFCVCVFFFSLSLSISLVIFFLPSLFSSFLLFFLLSCFCLFVSLLCFFAFVSWKEQHQNIELEWCFSSVLSVFWSPVLFCLSNPFCLSLLVSFS